jgi:predicted metal-binding protein
MRFTFQISDREYSLPGRYAVCDRCEGKGSHVNPNVDGNGLSAEDFDENPGFFEDYMAGVYDVTCSTCKGQRVVLEPNKSLITNPKDRAIYRMWLQSIREEAEYRALCESERKMGC